MDAEDWAGLENAARPGAGGAAMGLILPCGGEDPKGLEELGGAMDCILPCGGEDPKGLDNS